MKCIEQLNLWVDGKPVHNDERGECCPDFSCCNKEVVTPKEIKELFRDAYLRGNEELMYRLLGRFLTDAIGSLKSNKRVYIAGSPLT